MSTWQPTKGLHVMSILKTLWNEDELSWNMKQNVTLFYMNELISFWNFIHESFTNHQCNLWVKIHTYLDNISWIQIINELYFIYDIKFQMVFFQWSLFHLETSRNFIHENPFIHDFIHNIYEQKFIHLFNEIWWILMEEEKLNCNCQWHLKFLKRWTWFILKIFQLFFIELSIHYTNMCFSSNYISLDIEWTWTNVSWKKRPTF
jgi:hypothetical protein